MRCTHITTTTHTPHHPMRKTRNEVSILTTQRSATWKGRNTRTSLSVIVKVAFTFNPLCHLYYTLSKNTVMCAIYLKLFAQLYVIFNVVLIGGQRVKYRGSIILWRHRNILTWAVTNNTVNWISGCKVQTGCLQNLTRRMGTTQPTGHLS